MKIGKSPLIAGAIALIGVGYIASGQIGKDANGAEQSAVEPQQQEAAAALMAVRVADLVAQPRMEVVTITGRTEASRRVQLRAETAGQIVELAARRGDSVSADDVIAGQIWSVRWVAGARQTYDRAVDAARIPRANVQPYRARNDRASGRDFEAEPRGESVREDDA